MEMQCAHIVTKYGAIILKILSIISKLYNKSMSDHQSLNVAICCQVMKTVRPQNQKVIILFRFARKCAVIEHLNF